MPSPKRPDVRLTRDLALRFTGMREPELNALPGGNQPEFDLTKIAVIAANRAFKANATDGADVLSVKRAANVACLTLPQMRQAIDLGLVKSTRSGGLTYVPGEFCMELGTEISSRTDFGKAFLAALGDDIPVAAPIKSPGTAETGDHPAIAPIPVKTTRPTDRAHSNSPSVFGGGTVRN
jgi:hypothetical protein